MAPPPSSRRAAAHPGQDELAPVAGGVTRRSTARCVRKIMEPWSATISEPGGIGPLDGAEQPQGLPLGGFGVAQAVGGILGGGGAEHRPVPGPGRGRPGPESCRAGGPRRSLPPARAEVSACHAAAPGPAAAARRGVLARVVVRPASAACSCARSAPRRCSASDHARVARRALCVRNQPLLHR